MVSIHILRSPQREDGQALLAVVLLLVIILTIGLSLAARSITNVRQTSEEDNSQRAFSAAEAGIEVALSNDVGTTFSGNFTNDTNYEVLKRDLLASQINLQGASVFSRNEPVDIWLSQYPTYTDPFVGAVRLYWGEAGSGDSCDYAALEIVTLHRSIQDPLINHYAYDPCGRGNFSNSVSSGGVIDGKNYRYSVTINSFTTANPGFIMRIIPSYHDTIMAVRTVGPALPSQGTIIESRGVSGGTERKIVVVKKHPSVPSELFPYVLFTPNNQL